MDGAGSMTDDVLMGRLAAGDSDALRVLHGRYAALVFTVATSIAPPAAAEDVVQDVFLTIWRKRETFDPARGSFKGWIAQVARRRALNEVRRQRTRATEGDAALEQVADEGLPPDEGQWAEHRKAVLRAAVDALPPRERQALSLAFFEELTHEQVASVLEAPLGTVKTRIRLALRRLAPVVAALLTAVALIVGWRRADQQRARQERALVLVTSSDVVPLRLLPAPGAPLDAHGNYRGRAGTPLAVLTTSGLPALPGSTSYVGWVRRGEHWVRLGSLTVGADGKSLLVHEDVGLASAADEVRVTAESHVTSAPGGPVVLSWPAAPRP